MNNGLLRGFTWRTSIAPGKSYPDLERWYFDGTDLLLTPEHVNKVVTTRSSSPVTIRVPPMQIRPGECIFFKQKGTGAVTLVEQPGARIEGAFPGFTLRAQNSTCGLMLEGSQSSPTCVWNLFGDILSVNDPFWNSVVFLWLANDDNGTQPTLTDSSLSPATGSNTGIANSNYFGSSDTSVFGGLSGKFEPLGLFPPSAAYFFDTAKLRLGTGDFTIEGFLRPSGLGAAYGVISKRDLNGGANNTWSIVLQASPSGRLDFQEVSSGSFVSRTIGTLAAANEWHYFAVSRISGTLHGYLGTVASGTATRNLSVASTHNMDATGFNLHLGCNVLGPPAQIFNGYLDCFRITKGVGRYSAASIDVPSAQFPTG